MSNRSELFVTRPNGNGTTMKTLAGLLLVICVSFGPRAAWATEASFANFESPQARSLVVSRDGSQLFVVNTPAAAITIYSLKNPRVPRLLKEVPVGLEPVSLAENSNSQLWVVNHLSDSVSVVNTVLGAVVATIQLADRPGDIVFAGNPRRAFVTSMTERTVAVIDATTGKTIKKIPIAGNDPRTLLASEDGTSVWVAISRSGNQTTIVPHQIAPAPPEPANDALPPAPPQGIIVRSDDPVWQEHLQVKLADRDVFEIDAGSLQVRRSYQHLGTILFNMVQRPGSSELWVANTEARNLVRFEPQLNGHAIDSRVTRLKTGSAPQVTAVDLNPGIDYGVLPNDQARSTALSQPTDIVFDRSGERAYLAAFGSDRIAILDSDGKVTGRIEIGESAGSVASPRTKRGPRGLAHHPQRGVLYVLNRLSNSLSVVDTSKQQVLTEINMYDPTPQFIREGRGYVFDAKLSGNGTMSCASCHVDGDRDGLAWDLGDPGGKMFSNGSKTQLHPMKGPLLTQTLRGLQRERIFHWRADRPGLEAFNGAFASLLGGEVLNDDDLQSCVEYMKSIRFGPNPNRNRDDTLATEPAGTSPRVGEQIFMHKQNVGREGSSLFRCVDCHLNRTGTGNFGFTGLIQQPTKAAQLRGLYERDGRGAKSTQQLSGFGFGADGSKNDLVEFLAKSHRFEALTAQEKTALQRFLFSFPTETAPIVGFTRTVNASNVKLDQVQMDLNLLVAQAQNGRCDLVVTGLIDRQQVSLVYDVTQKNFTRRSAEPESRTLAQLIAGLDEPLSVLSFLALPPGTGAQRVAAETEPGGKPSED
jgi:YVTN family beta-propeller protein